MLFLTVGFQNEGQYIKNTVKIQRLILNLNLQLGHSSYFNFSQNQFQINEI